MKTMTFVSKAAENGRDYEYVENNNMQCRLQKEFGKTLHFCKADDEEVLLYSDTLTVEFLVKEIYRLQQRLKQYEQTDTDIPIFPCASIKTEDLDDSHSTEQDLIDRHGKTDMESVDEVTEAKTVGSWADGIIDDYSNIDRMNEALRLAADMHLLPLSYEDTGGEKPFTCAHCAAKFRSTSNLNQHMLMHTGVKSYMCTMCGKAFPRANSLRLHTMRHQAIKPHTCVICDKRFVTTCALKDHAATHLALKLYACLQCGQKFSSMSTLKRHERRFDGRCMLASNGKRAR